ncbi:MAG: acyl-CoA thioesterase, partial [Bacteroidota bacterium]
TSMVVGIRVESENIQSGFVKHCNSSYFTMVAKGEDGKSVVVPGLVLEKEIDVRRFIKSIKRIELKKSHQEEYRRLDALAATSLEQLENYNVELNLPEEYE